MNAPRRRLGTALIGALLFLASLYLYFGGQKRNPPAFYIDESSVAYNALTIAQHGVDEYGVAHPLYFRALDEYKNPVLIYLLAGVFKVTGPSNLVARRVSAAGAYLAAVVLGLLAWRITRNRGIAIITFATALVTPNLFETGRLAFEVALMPLATALVLLAAWRSYGRERWDWSDAAAIAGSLALFTYTYSSGRMLGPILLAALCALFYAQVRRKPMIGAVVAYLAVATIPIIVFNARHHGALTVRARALSVFRFLPDHTADVFAALERNTATALLPIGASLVGDPDPRHHVPYSGGSILFMTFVLAALSVWILWRRRELSRWWIFILIGTVACVLPSAITSDHYHALRLISYPVFLIVLSLPALAAREHRRIVAAAVAVGLVQLVWFSSEYVHRGPKRLQPFDYGAPEIVAVALDQPQRPVFVIGGVKIHAYWYASLRGAPVSAFEPVWGADAVPQNGLYIAESEVPEDELVAERAGYRMYRRR